MANSAVPTIQADYVVVTASWDNELTAVVSSYFNLPGSYLPVFEYYPVDVFYDVNTVNAIDEHAAARQEALGFARQLRETLRNIGGQPTVILAGLTAEQLSFLQLDATVNQIPVSSLEDVDFLLEGLPGAHQQALACRPEQVLAGLVEAAHSGRKLVLSLDVPDIGEPVAPGEGIIVLEDFGGVASVIAANYSIAVNATLLPVAALTAQERISVKAHIERWKRDIKHDDQAAFEPVRELIYNRVGTVDFSPFHFATFFTAGLPYGLTCATDIPKTYVHPGLAPDFFIIRAILAERVAPTGGAVVFSPGYHADEETGRVIVELQHFGLFVKELSGHDANVYNLDMHIREFPYDLLHICSHGSPIKGTTIKRSFVDQAGNPHEFVIDEVVSFAVSAGQSLVQVNQECYFRTLDGLEIGSAALAAQGLPDFVFRNMEQAALAVTKEDRLAGVRVDSVRGSDVIHCHDGNYIPLIDRVAHGRAAPVLFNNICWSAYNTCHKMIEAGVRGYIGTLWNILSDVATKAALVFYEEVQRNPIAFAVHEAAKVTVGKRDFGIYQYWGLHFSRLHNANISFFNRLRVIELIERSFFDWYDLGKKTTDAQTKAAISRLEKWNEDQLRNYFLLDYLKLRHIRMRLMRRR